jgi:2-haloacid dehalogenase
MNRRSAMSTLIGAVGSAALGHALRAQESHAFVGEIKAISFDAFVIFDPRPIEKRVTEIVPDKSIEFANLWRARQFEYCWLRTAAGRYVDFWQVTDDALRYTANSLKVVLNISKQDDLMDAFRSLPLWPDVAAGLGLLRQRGIRLALLSNFTSAMLDANLKATGLREFFEPHLTTDRVQSYKPSAQAYKMGQDAFGLQKSAIAFAASAAWDAAGAKWFGYPTVWVNRGGNPTEELDARPDVVAGNLSGLVDFVGRS